MGVHNVAKGHYVGAARFIELAPPGIQFRGLTNIDHIISITFAQKVEEVEILDEGGAGVAEVLDNDTGEVLQAAVPPPTHMEPRVTGFVVTVGVGGTEQSFTFARPDTGIAYYNRLLDDMVAAGVPCVLQPRIQLEPPAEAPAILGADGKKIEEGYEDEDLEDPVIDELEDLADEIAEDQILIEDKPTEH